MWSRRVSPRQPEESENEGILTCRLYIKGMLASASTIDVVSSALEDYHLQSLVLDPVEAPSPIPEYHGLFFSFSDKPQKVMVSTSGSQLLPAEALRNLRAKLLPRATVLTPNIPEARLLLADAGYGHLPVEKVDDLEVIAMAVHALGPKW